MTTDFSSDTAMTPDAARAFNAGAREGLMDALDLLWFYVQCEGPTVLRCQDAYCKLRGMIDAEFPAEDDADAR